MNRKLLVVILLILPLLYACSTAESSPESSIPKSWIVFQGNKYIYEASYSADEIEDIELQPTGEVTDSDDGTEKGLNIYKALESNSIFVKSETNGLIQWLRYSKVN